MNPSEEQKGTGAPPAGGASAGAGSHPADGGSHSDTPDALKPNTAPLEPAEPVENYDDGYPHEPAVEAPAPVDVKPEPPPTKEVATVSRRPGGGGKKPPSPPSGGGGGDDGDGGEDRMLRMSCLEHLEDSRARVI